MTVVCVSTSEFAQALAPLPAGVDVVVWDGSSDQPDRLAETTFWVPDFLATSATFEAMPALEVVHLISAGAETFVDVVPAGVTLCNAHGVHGGSTSEWAMTVLLAVLRDIPAFVRAQDAGDWARHQTDELQGKHVLVVGAGDLGHAMTRRLQAFDADVTVVARRARDGVHAISELPDLLPVAEVVVIMVPLTPATTGLVDAAFLAAMPDSAVLVNAARGKIVDTDALLAELTSGRLRAAIDVTEPEPLPADHPLWHAPNLLITPHVGGNVVGFEARVAALISAQLARYLTGEPLVNVVRDGY